MRTLNIKAGSILLWKQHSKIKKLWYRLINKTLPYNCVSIYKNNTEWIVMNDKTLVDTKILEPKKNYSRLEITMLKSFMENGKYLTSLEDTLGVINSVRPDTISVPTTLDDLINNKYYKAIC